MKKTFMHLKFVIVLLCFFYAVQAQTNSIRIADYTGNLPIPSNFLERVRAAGYTHVMAGIGEIITRDWQNGEYVGVDTGMASGVIQAFTDCSMFGLKYIPVLPSANHWSKEWINTNNSSITYQPYIANVMGNNANNNLISDDLVLQFINLFFNLKKNTSIHKISIVPSYAQNDSGFDKSYRSLLRDVIQYAFDQTGLPDSAFDLIHLGNDEPCTYDHGVAYEQKLLVGKSQEDLKWMYENDANHYGVSRCVITPEALVTPDSTATQDEWAAYYEATSAQNYQNILTSLSENGRKAFVYTDTVYFYDFADPGYKNGLRALIAENFSRRVQHTMDFLPGVRCIYYGDIMDPEHIGGYFGTADALQNLSDDSVTVQGVSTPITEKVLFMPWLYPNSFTHELEGEFTGAKLNTSVTSVVIGYSAAYQACNVLFPPGSGLSVAILRGLCKAGVTKFAYDQVVTKNSVDISVAFNATGGLYHLDSTLQHFVNNKFPVVYMNALEKGTVSSHTLAQLVKVLEEPLKFTPAQRDSFMLGYAVVAWGEDWIDTNSIYNQHPAFNNIEIFSSAFNWNSAGNSMLMFGDVRRNNTLNLFWARNPVSITDYFSTMKDLFNSYLADSANATLRTANFYDAVQFCNLLSIREGLTPVYTLSDIKYNSLWNTGDLDTVRHQFNVRGPGILSAIVQANTGANGYRLPNASEIQTLSMDTAFVNDTATTEWIWRGDSVLPTVFNHSTLDTVTSANENQGHAFRVIRRNIGLPKLAVFSKDEGLLESNISKPRVYVQNGSSVKISKFTVHYYFSVENGKTPILDQYWVPGSNLSLNQINDSLYDIQYYYAGELDTGNTVLPVLDGNVVGLHYEDWSSWDKTNDYSFNNSSSFVKNEQIVITDSAGYIISGEVTTTIPDPVIKQAVVSVYSRDEALNEGNMSKPRIFIQNTGNGKISQFTVHYYFSSEQGKTPIVEQYWVPGSAVSLQQVNDSLYEILYYFEGELGPSGAILPDMSGNVTGIHYTDWSYINKNNDFSFPNSSTFVRNANIAVTDKNGVLIYGRMP